MDNSPIRKASDLLSTILPSASLDQTNLWSDFFKSWKYIAGERFCVHARPVDVKNGIVIVEADHPGWIQLMQFEQSQLLRKLQNNFPELKLRGIAFKTKTDILPSTNPVLEQQTEETYNEIENEKKCTSLKEVLDEVKDPVFRSILDSLALTLDSENRKKNKKRS